jgi:xanthosine utilization system XapX-like protein
MGIVVGAVVEILWVEICAPPVVAGVSVEGQVHHLQQLMFDEQDVVQVKLNAAQRRGHWQSTVQQPAYKTNPSSKVVVIQSSCILRKSIPGLNKNKRILTCCVPICVGGPLKV